MLDIILMLKHIQSQRVVDKYHLRISFSTIQSETQVFPGVSLNNTILCVQTFKLLANDVMSATHTVYQS